MIEIGCLTGQLVVLLTFLGDHRLGFRRFNRRNEVGDDYSGRIYLRTARIQVEACKILRRAEQSGSVLRRLAGYSDKITLAGDQVAE